MSAHDNGGPAFPIIQVTQTEEGPFVRGNSGMTLRDYFAAKAAHQLMHGARLPDGYDASNDFRSIARRSYELADAMLAARNGGAA